MPRRCLKHQAALSVAYGAGLRVAEVSALKVSDIDSKRMLLRIERGKGGRYRNAMLPEGLLLLLRDWWRAGRQQGMSCRDGWLFPGQSAIGPDQHPPALPRRRRGRRGRGYRQAGRTAHLAPQLCHAPARGRRRYPRHPGAARSRQAQHHRLLHAGGDEDDAGGDQSARQACARLARTRSAPDG